MADTRDVIGYFALKYPHQEELSKARLTKLVYLADWFSALIDDEQITNIDWVFNHYGPYVNDIENIATSDELFELIQTNTMYGSIKHLISFKGTEEDIQISDEEKIILDAVIKKTKNMNFKEFIDYVYSTYPIKAKERYTNLNLVKLAKEFTEQQLA